MSYLVETLTSAIFWWTFLAGLVVCYGGFYSVAWLGESRKPGSGPNDVPIWRDQSRAFLPGDAGLSLLLAASVSLSAGEGTEPLYWFVDWAPAFWVMFVLGIGAGASVFYLARKFLYTPNDYTPGSWNSPTKRYHDGVMYFGFVTVLTPYFTIGYFWTDWSDGRLLVKLLGFLGAAVWLLGNLFDYLNRNKPHGVPNARQHPDKSQTKE